jgi:hypothetical protein
MQTTVAETIIRLTVYDGGGIGAPVVGKYPPGNTDCCDSRGADDSVLAG